MLKMSSFYTCVAKSQWCTVPEIRNGTDKNFSDFGPFFVLLPTHLPPPTHNDPKNQNLEKMKKMLGGIIILHMCARMTIMWCGSWDMEHDGLNFLAFWTVFGPVTLQITWKIKILKKDLKNEKTKQNKTKPQILSF